MIKQFYYNFFPLRGFLKKIRFLKKVIFHKGSKISNSHFEGKNVIGSNSTFINSSLGFGSYIANSSGLFNVSVGKFCSIGPNVVAGFGSHPVDFISTHPCFYSPLKQANFTFTESKSYFKEFKTNKNGKLVTIGNNCWIGYDVAILDGVVIGDGCIIAAKSLVTKDVPPYSVVAGIPGKVIKPRFDKEQISQILSMDKLWDLDLNWYASNFELFHEISNVSLLKIQYKKYFGS